MNNSGWIFAELIISIIISVTLGCVTVSIRNSKGYYGNKWFWFGFFCGIPAIIVACALPSSYDSYSTVEPGGLSQTRGSKAFKEPDISAFSDQAYVKETVSSGGWQCVCGRAHPVYVSTCSCGLSKRQNSSADNSYAARVTERAEKERALTSELRKYRVMLDADVITQEEYDAKVKALYKS
jgi:hypothetical protein